MMGNTYLYFYYYLGYGYIRPEVAGQPRALIERVAEQTTAVKTKQAGGTEVANQVPLYRPVHVIGYSFGSLVAIVSLFPFNQVPPDRYAIIDAFVTIGCPFDLIRTYFKEYPVPGPLGSPGQDTPSPYSYFDRRGALPNAPRRWLNVYCLSDVMSANFRDDEQVDQPEAHVGIGLSPEGEQRRRAVAAAQGPVRPENRHFIGPFNAASTTWWDLLTLYGNRSHAGYWGPGAEVEVNCFDVIVPWLDQGHPDLE
jgi:hypothetical protein